MTDFYFADTARFPHDTIDGETVLIDSEKGHLFLFTGIGSSLWQRVALGATIDGVVAESIERYGESAGNPTRQFLEKLAEAEMLRRGLPHVAAPAEIDWPTTFAVPIIERYDEISDIISMDPIHEVDPARGWPRRADGTP